MPNMKKREKREKKKAINSRKTPQELEKLFMVVKLCKEIQ